MNQPTNNQTNEETRYDLWARVGMSMRLTDKEMEELVDDRDTFMRFVEEGKIFLDGETYFPEEVGLNDRLKERKDKRLWEYHY